MHPSLCGKKNSTQWSEVQLGTVWSHTSNEAIRYKLFRFCELYHGLSILGGNVNQFLCSCKGVCIVTSCIYLRCVESAVSCNSKCQHSIWMFVHHLFHVYLCEKVYAVILISFRVAVLRRWRSKYGPHATYRSLANCFYRAEQLDMVEVVCQALGAPSSSAIQQQEGTSSIVVAVH